MMPKLSVAKLTKSLTQPVRQHGCPLSHYRRVAAQYPGEIARWRCREERRPATARFHSAAYLW